MKFEGIKPASASVQCDGIPEAVFQQTAERASKAPQDPASSNSKTCDRSSDSVNIQLTSMLVIRDGYHLYSHPLLSLDFPSIKVLR